MAMVGKLLLAASALVWTVPSGAQDTAAKAASPASAAIVPQVASIRAVGTFNGRTVPYRVTMGETVLKGSDGTEKAVVVTTAYIAEPRDASRPVLFLFNGGPGAGTLWLQMGSFGPKRVAIPSDARDDGAPPYPLVDNPDALLDVADIVFIDPPGTGFSYLVGKTDPKEFYGITADARAVAQVIRRWINDNGRWNSPKYVGGESYGTTRSAAVVNELESAYNDVALNGVILISTVLDYGAGADRPGNELSYITNVPSFAAAAHFHGKAAAPSVEAIVEEARQFALGPYASALLKGQKLGAAERTAVRRELSRLTGLSETYLERADLRVTPDRFYKELLRDRGLTIGRLDARYTGKDYDNAGEEVDNDPSFYGIDGGYNAAMNSYARDTVGFKSDRPYQAIASLGQWDFTVPGGRDENAYLNVTPWLGTALRENSGMRIFVAQGYYDFATPFFAAEYALSRTGIPQDRVEFHYYGAGHMMYVRDEDRRKLSADVRAFLAKR